MFRPDCPGHLSAPRARRRRVELPAAEPLEPRVLLAFTYFGSEAASELDQPAAIAVADFNADGIPDAAVANASGNDVTILLGSGDGTLIPTPTRYGTGPAPRAIAAGDLTGDGLADLVVANSLSSTVTVLQNFGGGLFAPGVEVFVGSRPRAVVIADLNGNGRLDLAVALFNTNQVAVLLNSGAPGSWSFTNPIAYSVGAGPVALVAADLDGDGDLDLATANITSGTVSILRNNGAGGFTGAGAHAVGSVPRAIAAADLDGDGAVDLAVANSFSGTVSILRNLGNAAFAPQVEYFAGNQPHSLVIGDFDGDGDLDIAAANLISNDVGILANTGAGTFAAPQMFPAGSGPIAIAAADVDGDGDIDFLVANSLGNSLTLLRSGLAPENQPPSISGIYVFQSPVVLGQPLTLAALDVLDPDGFVTEVRFYRDSNGDGLLSPSDEGLFPIDTDGSDGWMWSGVASPTWPAGPARFFAQAFDNEGRAGNLAAIEVVLLRPPSIAVLAITPGPIQPGQAFTLTAMGVTDTDGTVQSVRFFRDSNGNGVLDAADQELTPADTDGSNGYTWTGTANPAWGPGQVRFFARAADNHGLLSAPASVVATQTFRPTIAGATATPNPLIFGETVTLTATGVADQDGTVSLVRFYADADGDGVLDPASDVLLGTVPSGGGGYTLAVAYPTELGPIGSIRFFAVAVDNLGAPSLPRAFTTALRYRPVVEVLVPSAYSIEPGNRLNFTALASDFDGAVTSVSFYRDTNNNGVLDGGDELIGADSSGADGFTAFFDIPEVQPSGIQRFFARATDNHSLLSNVASVEVLVNRAPGIDGFIASPDPVRYFQTLFLQAFPFDTDGEITQVFYYRDADGDGQISDGDELVGIGLPGSSEAGFGIEVTVPPSWGPGQALFFAVALDSAGALSESALAAATIQPVPVIGALVPSPDIALVDTMLTLTAQGVQRDEGTVAAVRFYRDANGNGVLDGADELLGADTSAAGGWRITVNVSPAWPRGFQAFFAVAEDTQERTSPPATALVVIGGPPAVATLTASPDPVAAGQLVTLTAGGVTSADGSISAVRFYFDANGNGVLDADELATPIEGEALGGGAWRTIISVPPQWSGGQVRFFARAFDDINIPSAAVPVVFAVTPLPILAFLDASSGTVYHGLSFTLSAAPGAGGPLSGVSFYRDANANGVLDEGDEPLVSALLSGAGLSWSGVVPDHWPLGRQTFFAVPFGPGGAAGEPVAAELDVWTRIFFPEGWRNDTTINEYLPLVNPHPFPVHYRVVARYEIGERDGVIYEGEIAPFSRGGITIAEYRRPWEALTRPHVGYALEVQSSAPLGATLSRYDNFSGVSNPNDAANGEAFTSVASQVWTFPDVQRIPRQVFDFLVYYNPTESDGEVIFNLYFETGASMSILFTLSALRRGGLNFSDPSYGIPFGRFSVVATSTVPLVMAQSRYEAHSGHGFTALGEPSLGSTSVLIPGAQIRPGVVSSIVVFNPSTFEPTQVAIGIHDESSTGDGPISTIFSTIDPGQAMRFNLDDTVLPANARYTLRIESDLPVVAQASTADFLRGDATATASPAPATGWLFADAFLDSDTAGVIGFEYLTLSNPHDAPLTVTVFFYFSTGDEPEPLSVELAPRQSRTIELHKDATVPIRSGLNFYSLGAFADAPFVALFTHWDLFQNGGWSTFGTPALLTTPPE